MVTRYWWQVGSTNWIEERFVVESDSRPIGLALMAHPRWEVSPDRRAEPSGDLLPAERTAARLDVVFDALEERARQAGKVLAGEGIRINVTLCFTVNQALLAAAIGAYFISPFVGRLDDIGEDGMQVVRDIVAAYRQQEIETKVLAASLRHPVHVTQAALAGADIDTMPFKVLESMYKHPLTDTSSASWRITARRMSRSRSNVEAGPRARSSGQRACGFCHRPACGILRSVAEAPRSALRPVIGVTIGRFGRYV